MCLILFAVDPSKTLHLVVAANRDEQHSRATARADYWQDHPDLLGGRDLVAGGTWLGINRNGRFAAVTNFAEVPAEPLPPRSRGELTANFLVGDMNCVDYLSAMRPHAQEYRGFNLLISDGHSVFYFSNRENQIRQLDRGFYGLSNQLLDCDWPKVTSGRNLLERQLVNSPDSCSQHNRLFDLLADQGDGTPHSARFIRGDDYGTSVSTVVELSRTNIHFEERGFDPAGRGTQICRYQLDRSK
tara:strand:- start:13357 stop:14085 length:729 start_codon:yes stop_codon:yes gene_type:complete